MSKRDAALYRKAAKRIETGENSWSCCAIEEALPMSKRTYGAWHPATEKYRQMFAEAGSLSISQFDETGDGEGVRIVALCLMAAMAEAGDA
jgi:hypothetical protein